MLIRDASPEDLPTIRDIYNDALVNTTAIWNDTLVDLANRQDWFAARIRQGYPVIVAVDGDRIAGYGSFGDFRAFDGYRFTVEHSVYVAADRRGRGTGRQILAVLADRARALGKHVMVGCIDASNTASLALHRRFGFTDVGTIREVGTKFDRWLDLAIVQLVLTADLQPPRR